MKAFKSVIFITQIGLDIISSILVGYLIGYGLDKLFKIKSSIFSMVFLIIGVFSGFYQVYQRIKKSGAFDKKDPKSYTKDHPSEYKKDLEK